MENFWGVGRWVLIVFVTGVIAGFGKILASWMVSRRRRQTRAGTLPDLAAGADPAAAKRAKDQAKITKKLAKAEAKRRKKA